MKFLDMCNVLVVSLTNEAAEYKHSILSGRLDHLEYKRLSGVIEGIERSVEAIKKFKKEMMHEGEF